MRSEREVRKALDRELERKAMATGPHGSPGMKGVILERIHLFKWVLGEPEDDEDAVKVYTFGGEVETLAGAPPSDFPKRRAPIHRRVECEIEPMKQVPESMDSVTYVGVRKKAKKKVK